MYLLHLKVVSTTCYVAVLKLFSTRPSSLQKFECLAFLVSLSLSLPILGWYVTVRTMYASTQISLSAFKLSLCLL